MVLAGYKNQQFNSTSSAIMNWNSGTCLTAASAAVGAPITISACKPADPKQSFSQSATSVVGPAGLCLAAGGAGDAPTPSPSPSHCCASGWVSQIDSQQDLTLDSFSGPGYWNDNGAPAKCKSAAALLLYCCL